MEKKQTNVRGDHALPFFLAGLGLGIVTTALLVPRSGARTRRFIGETVREGEGWVKAKAAEAREYVSSRGVELGDRVKEAAEEIGRSS